MSSCESFLRRHRRIAIDTCVFIYQLELHPTYSGLTDQVFVWLERSGHSGVTSTITLTEFLVQPYRRRRQDLADKFYTLFSFYPNLEWIPPSLRIADSAAALRAKHGLPTMDALQAATAIHSGASALITNDPVFARVPDLDILVLDDAVGS
jgi:predicted nucleic acid-binding protein